MTEESPDLVAGYALIPSDPRRLASIKLVRRLCNHTKPIDSADKPVPFLGHAPPRVNGGARVDLVVKIAAVDSDKHIERFMREEETWATAVGLKHSKGTSGNVRWFARRYIPGQSLDVAARSNPDDIPVYARRTLEAIRELHRKDEAHFDIKPTNMIITADGAVLIDFEASSGDDGIPTVPLVTPAYAAPEQLLWPHGSTPGTAADVFGWGLSIAQLYQPGFHPFCDGAFSDSRMREIQAAVDRGSRPPEPDLSKVTDIRVKQIVADALTWDADTRPSAELLLGTWKYADEDTLLYGFAEDPPTVPKETFADSFRTLVFNLSWQGALGNRKLSAVEYSLLGVGGLVLGILGGLLLGAVIP